MKWRRRLQIKWIELCVSREIIHAPAYRAGRRVHIYIWSWNNVRMFNSFAQFRRMVRLSDICRQSIDYRQLFINRQVCKTKMYTNLSHLHRAHLVALPILFTGTAEIYVILFEIVWMWRPSRQPLYFLPCNKLNLLLMWSQFPVTTLYRRKETPTLPPPTV